MVHLSPVHTGVHAMFHLERAPPEGNSSCFRCEPELVETKLVGDMLGVQVSQRDHILEGRDMSL